MAVIEVEGLTLPGRLDGVSLQAYRGEVLGLIGPNGAGKSSLLKCLCGIEHCAGQIRYDGRASSELSDHEKARKLGFLPQSCRVAWSLKVRDVIALGRLPWGDENPQVIEAAARKTDVSDWLDKRVDKLSGGQQARVWLARVLAGEPELLLADEPVASLDLFHQLSVMAMLQDYARQGAGVVVSLHDIGLAARFCDRICLLHNGQVHALGTPEEVVTRDNLRRVYGVDSHIDLQANPPIVIPRQLRS